MRIRWSCQNKLGFSKNFVYWTSKGKDNRIYEVIQPPYLLKNLCWQYHPKTRYWYTYGY